LPKSLTTRCLGSSADKKKAVEICARRPSSFSNVTTRSKEFTHAPDIHTTSAALWFAQKGHPILALHSATPESGCTCGDVACASPGKHPHAGYAPHGVKDATLDLDVIRGWFAEAYWLNYGVACTKIFVVDVDTKHRGLDTWYSMHAQPTRFLPHTWQVRTGSGGLHVLFEPPSKARNGNLEKGIQLKATGGYIVGCGSKHASGGVYDWEPQCSPAKRRWLPCRRGYSA
jgi:Bifunctional DNA primase/polymerase, N-terminal